jgi:serine/threonine protein kinase
MRPACEARQAHERASRVRSGASFASDERRGPFASGFVSSSTQRANAAAAARIGSTIAGKYRLNRLLGVGGIGAVFAAVHQFTGKHVALKILEPTVIAHEGYAARFIREARAAAEIGHPAICDVVDAGYEPDGALYLALELLEGRTLGAAIEAKDISQAELVNVAIQLLEGLAAAHDRGIVHRDIKPENVFLTYDSAGELRVKLLDFGVAKSTKGSGDMAITQQGVIVGTPYYMSPEQAAGDPVDARADLWSTGAVLFHALTGRPPFDEDSYNKLIAKLLNHAPPRLRTIAPSVPDWLATVVDGALQRDPEARWHSARTMIDALKRQGGAPIELDWEVHEDQTVRTDAIYESGEDEKPAIAAIQNSAPNIEIDISLTGGFKAIEDTAATTPEMPNASHIQRPKRSRAWVVIPFVVIVVIVAAAFYAAVTWLPTVVGAGT